MGFFKKLFGQDKQEPEAETAESRRAATKRSGEVARQGDPRDKNRAGRPPLADAPPPSQSIDDALCLRESGDREGARKLFAEIDRGAGLRTVLHAASALEEGDEAELSSLLPAVELEAGWKVLLQVAAALDDAEKAAPYVERAALAKAPTWAVAWTRAMSSDAKTRREGLVELLFSDAPLARTVAARDLNLGNVIADAEAASRYAAFAHGRDSIRRFGAELVARTLDRALRTGGAINK